MEYEVKVYLRSWALPLAVSCHAPGKYSAYRYYLSLQVLCWELQLCLGLRPVIHDIHGGEYDRVTEDIAWENSQLSPIKLSPPTKDNLLVGAWRKPPVPTTRRT